MCVGPLKPKVPEAPPPPAKVPEAAATPATAPNTRGNNDASRRRRAAGGAGVGTILTGSRGVTNGASTSTKTLLGQ